MSVSTDRARRFGNGSSEIGPGPRVTTVPARVEALAALAGAVELGTGSLLVAAPELALRLLRIPGPPAEPVWLRFVGVFVAAVGVLYLLARLGAPARRAGRLVAALESTAVVRAMVAAFLGACVAVRALPPGWLLVAGFDAALATAQLAWTRRAVTV
jgi:hypothetical protein